MAPARPALAQSDHAQGSTCREGQEGAARGKTVAFGGPADLCQLSVATASKQG